MNCILLTGYFLLGVRSGLVCPPQVVFNFNPVIPCGAPNIAEDACYKLNCCWQWLDPDGKYVNTDIPNPQAGLAKPVCHQQIEEADILTAPSLTATATPNSIPTFTKNGEASDKVDKPQDSGGMIVWISVGVLTFAVIIIGSRYFLKKRNRGISTDFSQEAEVTRQNIFQRRTLNQPTRMSAIKLPLVDKSSITWEALSAQSIPEGHGDDIEGGYSDRFGNQDVVGHVNDGHQLEYQGIHDKSSGGV